MKEAPLKTGDEHDAFNGWRRIFHWKAGTLKSVKNGFRRRVRRGEKKLIERQMAGE